jgi:secreted trypsin-like serine protease
MRLCRLSLSRTCLLGVALALLCCGPVTHAAAAGAATGRVINGAAAATAWPFMVAIANAKIDNAFDAAFCGGTLVHPGFVVTAAHCVVDAETGEPIPADFINVVAGTNRLTGVGAARIGVSRIIPNPDYDPRGFLGVVNDIAILQLADTLALAPVRLARATESHLVNAGRAAVVLGWGQVNPVALIFPDDLQEAQVPILSNETCAATLGLLFKPEPMLCAGRLASTPDAADGVGTCFGDSGGPLLVSDGEVWTQVGITSWGFECASDRSPDAYTRVSQYADWVDSVLDVAGRARDALDHSLQVIRRLRERESVVTRKALRRRIGELRDLARVLDAEAGRKLPRFTLTNVRTLGKEVRRDHLIRATRLVRRMLRDP